MLVGAGKEDADAVDVGRRNATPLVVVLLMAATLAGCAPKRILRVTTAPADSPAEPAATAAVADRVVALAKEQLGTPYAFGGDRPDRGFDCSGLVRWAYGQLGVVLPRSVAEMAGVGRPVESDDLQAGDLVFFSIHDRGGPDHVGIYAEKHRFLHAPKTGDVVRSESLNDAWWRRRWTATRRVN